MLALVLIALVFPQMAWATTYYVGTTGSDSNPGSSGSRFLTINKCHSVMVAGDTCLVGDGTYTDADGDGRTFVTTNGHNGTSGSPITIKSENKWGAIITVPGVINTQNDGMILNSDYLIIDGFEITGGTSGTGSVNSHTGITVYGGTGVILRNNKIHDIARTLCYNDPYGNAGIFANTGVAAIEISNNIIYGIGRLRNGESGCSTTIYQHDHGMYIDGVVDGTIKYNLIYDSNRGYPIQVSGGTSSNLTIAHNTLGGHSPTGLPAAQMVLGGTLNTADIVNNLSYDAPYFLDPTFVTATSVTVHYNIGDGAEKVTTASGVTFSNNIQNSASLNLTNPGSNIYTLQSTSAARDAGTILSGYSYSGSAPDMGYDEYIVSEGGGGSTGNLGRSSKGLGLF